MTRSFTSNWNETVTDKTKKTTLTDSEIKSGRGIGRRAFVLGAIGGTTALAGCVPASTGITDADLGAYADPVGNGRGGTRVVTVRRSCTDSDLFPADPVGAGRRC